MTRRDVAFELARLTEEHGKSSARHARSVLRALWTRALREGIAGEGNPVAFTNDPNTGAKPRERVLSPPEIRAIWRTLPDTEYGNIVRLCFFTACRRSELGNLEGSEIDFSKALLTIPGEKTKNHRTHRLPLSPEAIEILKSIPRREGNSFVFGSRHGFTTFSYRQNALVACLAVTGDVAEPWSLHEPGFSNLREEIGSLLGINRNAGP